MRYHEIVMTARDVAVPSSKGSRSSSGAPSRPAGLAERYRSLFVIGRGGMGTVEAALKQGETQPDFERIVALKRLLPDSARDTRRTEMFLREAKLAELLDHPNVVRAFDYGEIEGELYLAMEYVEGQPLSRVAKPLPPGVAAHVLAEICEGLHAAHELKDDTGAPLNLVHRDVSPQNVMIAYDGRVKLLDFGVAKIEAESVTKTGEVKGKTAYMSPEQAMGDAIDRRSDLFGVGALLYECVAGKRMWGDGTDMEVIRKLALEEPPELEGVPPEMAALYKRLVAREAKDRPETAAEVAKALRALEGDGAAKELQAIIRTQFGGQAEEQRARLAEALQKVAPEQAVELRESVVPSSSPSLHRESVPPVADAKPAPAKSRTPAVALLLAVGIAAFVAWRMWFPPTPEPKVEVTNAHASPSPSPSPNPNPSPSANPNPNPNPNSNPSSNPTATTTATTTSSAKAHPTAVTAAPTTTTARPTTATATTTATTTATATATAPTTTATTTAKPPDVDPHPF
jgi:serine/threonine-protein kinase